MKLVFEDEALEWIAEEALKRDTGARALRAIMEEFMLDIMYEVPKDPGIGTVVITRNYLEKHGGPRYALMERLLMEGSLPFTYPQEYRQAAAPATWAAAMLEPVMRV